MLLIGGLLSTLTAVASSGEQQLRRFLTDLITLKAEFEQQVSRASSAQGEFLSKGTLYLRRPGRFRWDYLSPPQLIVADGSRVWLYDRELEQISHQRQARALRGTPALLLTDTGPIERYFEIRDLGHYGGADWVELVPKEEEAEFDSIRAGFSDNRLQKLQMIDDFGQITRFRFSAVERNPQVDPQLFVFTAPPGIDVIGD